MSVCQSFKSAALRNRPSATSLANSLKILQISPQRHFHLSRCRRLIQAPSPTTPLSTADAVQIGIRPEPTPLEKAESAARKARQNIESSQERARSKVKMGGLAPGSAFSEDIENTGDSQLEVQKQRDELTNRNYGHMARVLNPKPNARARWQRHQVIRHVRRGGRLTKEMKIARTERNHLSKSHFFKTSMKKLAPLARQIAGKSVDEAILQMRFSKKKVAQEVREHLLQARNEAIVMKGMGVKSGSAMEAVLPSGPVILDPSITPPEEDQNPMKAKRRGVQVDETDIYVAEAWTNPGPYGREPEYRARGRVNILRPPHTGLSVVLKEEKTRTRQQVDKEVKAIKKRLGKTSWTQLPDRKVTKQSQYVLW